MLARVPETEEERETRSGRREGQEQEHVEGGGMREARNMWIAQTTVVGLRS
jgi:hypothetical protein